MKKRDRLPDYLLNFFDQLVNKISALLLRKINVLVIFDMGDFFKNFFVSRNTEILIKSNF